MKMTRRSALIMGSATMLMGPTRVAFAKEADLNTLTDEEKKGGWKLLFNGADTTGWHRFGGGDIGWVIEDGALALRSSGGGNIVTDEEFGDFELTIDWKISPNGNSGVMYFVRELPDTPEPYMTGPEMQVLDNVGHSDGKIPSHTAGALYDMITPSLDVSRPVGAWNRAKIIVVKGHIEHWLNGVKVAETTYGDKAWRELIAKSKFANMPHFAEVPVGRLCLQDHGNPVWFRNIKIRRL